MATTDVVALITWWGYLLLIGFVFYPLARRIFASWIDHGYIFAKTIGILITTYVILLTSFLHIAYLTQGLVLLVLFLFFLLLYSENVRIRGKSLFLQFTTFTSLKQRWKTILIEEIIFLTTLFFLAYIRAFSPDIHGLEKYMDFGFMNSILRGATFPPKDMWLTPFSINYYYFGHFYSAMLIKLTRITPGVSYNLILATVFGLTFTGVFSLGSNLYAVLVGKLTLRIKTFLAGILSAALVTLSGNLHILYAFFTPYENENPVPFFAKKCLQTVKSGCTQWGEEITKFSPLTFPNSYWYPNATRFIHNTIHEFPMYSWIVADLHGHVLDMPFVILTISVLFAVFQRFQSAGSAPSHLQKAKRESHTSLFQIFNWETIHLLFIGLLLAVMYMTNAWDGLIYLLLASLIYVFICFRPVLGSGQKKGIKQYVTQILNGKDALVRTVYYILLTFISFLAFSLPFSLSFKPFVSGIGVLCAPNFLFKQIKTGTSITYDVNHIGPFLFEPNHCLRSPLWQLLILYGFFLFFAIIFFILLKKIRAKTIADYFILSLILLATLLIIIPEFIYVKDIYPDHYRANTMFKLVFQSFIMLSIVSAYTISKFMVEIKHLASRTLGKIVTGICLLLFLILIGLVFTYPFLGIQSYYGKIYQGLDGMQYLRTLYPDDYAAINWLNHNITGQPVILEAQGDSYTDYARVSANTGLPTVLGWTVHEWLWRGSYDLPSGEIADAKKIYDVPAPRIPEVQTLYETSDIQEAKRLLGKYHIAYVFIGSMEYEKYPKLNEQKFGQLGKIIFQKGRTKIYKISH